MKLTIPELSLVVLIGPSGTGKSTFARAHFKATEVLSSDFCRGLVSDDENDQTATDDAFEVLHFIAAKRLSAGKLTVIDATNVQPEARKPLVALARQYHCLPVAIVFNLPIEICQNRNRIRPDRNFGVYVIKQQQQQLRKSLHNLAKEGFRHVFTLSSPAEIETITIERQPLWNNLKHEQGPFDIIGDIHGCFTELSKLLHQLGYSITEVTDNHTITYQVSHRENRKVIFLGDLVDRGPQTPEVLRLVMDMVKSGVGLAVPGNHDTKLMRKLMGKPVQVRHGLAESLAQLEGKPPEFLQEIISFIDSRVSHYLLDNGQLVVAHAGMKQELQGRGSGKVRDFALYGETTGETDEFGFPIRYNWAAEYRGKAMVVYGHTPIPEAEWLNNTINIDTGCVFGGKLTALRYPEKELVSIAAEKVYFASTKPLVKENKNGSLSAQQQHDDILDIADVLGKRIISTRLYRNITIRAEQAIAALEVMSRFAANPKWLIYLPPTMSPCETTHQPGLLEHPAEAFAYYRHQGVPIVVCEEKHMGSRAVIIICRNAEAASKYFGVNTGEIGICYTRTGRRFFDDSVLERELLNRIQTALTITDSWEKFQTEWVCLDCELMPWSAKAQELIRQQYAAVGIAARSALAETVNVLAQVEARGIELVKHHGIPLTVYYQQRATMVKDYVEAYRHYCWPIHSINDFKIAPFHLLATTSGVNIHNNHIWHMDTLAEICQADNQLLFATPYQLVDVTDEKSQQQGIEWWQQLTAGGGEGMVVKPLDFAVKGEHGLVQPAIKCRGKEYLRIIYGPEYSATENLSRLRARSLATKRALALREFALGIEALERFVRQEPLRRVHECSFGILALESEPVDPRL